MINFLKINSIYRSLFTSRIIGGILQTLMFTIVARQIGSENFGKFCATLVIIQLLGTLFEFGFGSLVMSKHFTNDFSDLVSILFSTTILVSAVEGSIGLVSFLLISDENVYISIFSVLLLWGAGERLSNIGLSLAISQNHDGEVRRNILTRRIFSFICFILVSWQYSWTILSFCIFLSVSSLIGGLISTYQYKYLYSRINRKDLAKVIKFGLPFFANSVLNQMRNIDVFLLSVFSSPTAAGNYALAARLSQPISFPMSALAQTGIMTLSSGNDSMKSTFMKLYSSLFKNTLIVLTMICFIPFQKLSTYLLRDYSEIDLCLKIQLAAFIFFGVIALEIAILQGIEQQAFVYKNSFVGILMNLLLISIGGFLYGASGASIGLLAGNLFQSILLYLKRRNLIVK